MDKDKDEARRVNILLPADVFRSAQHAAANDGVACVGTHIRRTVENYYKDYEQRQQQKEAKSGGSPNPQDGRLTASLHERAAAPRSPQDGRLTASLHERAAAPEPPKTAG